MIKHLYFHQVHVETPTVFWVQLSELFPKKELCESFDLTLASGKVLKFKFVQDEIRKFGTRAVYKDSTDVFTLFVWK